MIAPIWELIKVALVAALPILEVKVAVPMGIAFGLPAWQVFASALIGSILPCPFILLFFRWGLGWLSRVPVRWMNRFGAWLEARTRKKQGKIAAGRLIFLFLFVAIPIPTTGVWMGSAIAALIKIDIRQALPIIFFGNVVATLIMMGLGVIVF